MLSHTLIALAAGHGLDEHDSPGEAIMQVLHRPGRWAALVLLTVAKAR